MFGNAAKTNEVQHMI